MRLTKTGRLVAVVSKRTIHVFTRSRSKAGLGGRHATSMQAGAAARVSRETGAERVSVLYFYPRGAPSRLDESPLRRRRHLSVHSRAGELGLDVAIMVMSYLKPFHQLGKLVGHVVRAGTMSKTVRRRAP